MATVQSIGKAQATGLVLQQMFGQQPDFEYATDHVRIYYTPDKLQKVQNKIATMAASGPGDVRIDWLPMVAPLALKKAVPYALGALAIGYIAGKIL